MPTQRKLKFDHAPVNSLVPSGFNVNVVSPDNEAKIDESLKRIGFFKPILCREVNGKLQIIGGEHRWQSAKRLGYTDVPVINLGPVEDQRAKEISLIDNARYGEDDTLGLAQLLEELGTPEDLAKYMPHSETDLATIFASTSINLDDLDLPDDSDSGSAALPSVKTAQTHQIVRFKVPVDDVDTITKRIERVMNEQGFKDDDSLSNAGNALVHIFKETA
jgi:ParB-like chromosome segregation protein Spo0J